MWEAMGPVAKMWSMAVDQGEPWRVVKLVGVAGGTRRCLAESGPRAPSAEARGVPGAPVLLRSPRRTHRSGRMQERRWFMSLTSETQVCMYVCMYIYIYIYIYMCVCMYVCMAQGAAPPPPPSRDPPAGGWLGLGTTHPYFWVEKFKKRGIRVIGDGGGPL